MARVLFSEEERSIEYILSWYEDQIVAIVDLRNKIIEAVINGKSNFKINPKFVTLTLDEIERYFDDSEDELEHLVCFYIISATEALLRTDYFKKVYKKDKSDIGKAFRDKYKVSGEKVSLEEDIIEVWKTTDKKRLFSDFLGLLKYRHWLAHGRYWKPRLGREYSFDVTYQISESIFDVITN